METKQASQEIIGSKVVAPKTIFYTEGITTLHNIQAYADREVASLMQEVENRGLEATGPLEFIYFGCCGDMDKPFTLQIALPVKEAKPGNVKFLLRETTPFKCLSYDYKGDVSQMYATYEMLYQQMAQKQWQPTDEVREVYKQWEHLTSPNNVTEIQIGLQE